MIEIDGNPEWLEGYSPQAVEALDHDALFTEYAWMSPAMAEAVAERMRQAWADPEFHAERRRAIREAWQNPELLAVHAETARRVHRNSDPVVNGKRKASLAVTLAKPEVAQGRSERMKARWQDPEFKARVSAKRAAAHAAKRAAKEAAKAQ